MRYQYYRLGHIINMKSLGDHLYIFVKILGKYKGKILVVGKFGEHELVFHLLESAIINVIG